MSVSDGGEGFLDSTQDFVGSSNTKQVILNVRHPSGLSDHKALVLIDQKTAYLEVAKLAGLL